jgi:hypothetical protein
MCVSCSLGGGRISCRGISSELGGVGGRVFSHSCIVWYGERGKNSCSGVGVVDSPWGVGVLVWDVGEWRVSLLFWKVVIR